MWNHIKNYPHTFCCDLIIASEGHLESYYGLLLNKKIVSKLFGSINVLIKTCAIASTFALKIFILRHLIHYCNKKTFDLYRNAYDVGFINDK